MIYLRDEGFKNCDVQYATENCVVCGTLIFQKLPAFSKSSYEKTIHQQNARTNSPF